MERPNRQDLCALYSLPNIRVIKSNKNQMGGTCGTYGVQERYIETDSSKEDHLEDLRVDGSITLK